VYGFSGPFCVPLSLTVYRQLKRKIDSIQQLQIVESESGKIILFRFTLAHWSGGKVVAVKLRPELEPFFELSYEFHTKDFGCDPVGH